MFYMIAQIVGAGALIQILFGIPYEYAVISMALLMSIYVSFGGMLATTWIQISKAVLLLLGGSILLFLLLGYFDMQPTKMVDSATNNHRFGVDFLTPGKLLNDPITAISLGLAFLFGPAGLPHIVMRLFTVPDARIARRSVFYATIFIGYFQMVVFVLGIGVVALVLGDPAYMTPSGHLSGGQNMGVLHLSHKLGGDVFLGITASITFATILAVVAGLTLATASAVSHDLYTNVIRNGKTHAKEELLVSRIAIVMLSIITVILGLLFKGQNLAFLATLSLSVSASVNFPLLFLALFYRGLTTKGACWGGVLGLFSTLTLVVLSPAIWVAHLGFDKAVYPYTHPTLFSAAICLISIWFFSVIDRSTEKATSQRIFEQQILDSHFNCATQKKLGINLANKTP